MMEETCIYDKEQYFRFASADLESAYIKFLCGDNTDESADSDEARVRRESSEAEAGIKVRLNGRQRRNSGRRRRRTEGEESAPILNEIEILRQDFNHLCKFYSAPLEERYLMYLSNTLPDDHFNRTSKIPNSNSKAVRNAGQRSRDRSSRSREKQRRQIEEAKENVLETTENVTEFKHAGRPRGRPKPRGFFAMTPYQGLRRCCGEFHCGRCFRFWTSSNSRANVAQPCNHCGLFVYPHTQWPLPWSMLSYGWLDNKETLPLDELADQENRPVGGKLPMSMNGEEPVDKIGDRRPAHSRHRRPLRTQHRRRREQEV